MVRELIRDYVAEEFYEDLIPVQSFGTAETPTKAANQCIVFCKKVSPNVFNIKKGLAVIARSEKNFNDGICMVAPDTKIVFVFE